MTWEFWFTLVIALILIGTVILVFVGIKKKDNQVRFSNYLFAYRITDGDAKSMPTEFLVNWKISNLENHLYLLYLTLEEDLYMYDYLKGIWQGYYGKKVYIEVYKKGTNHEFLGRFIIMEGGKVCRRMKRK